MKWPFVSRRRYDALAAALVRAEARGEDYMRAHAMEREFRLSEEWRRIKADGHVQWMQERIRRVLGLPGF